MSTLQCLLVCGVRPERVNLHYDSKKKKSLPTVRVLLLYASVRDPTLKKVSLKKLRLIASFLS